MKTRIVKNTIISMLSISNTNFFSTSCFITGANFVFLKFLKQIKCDENHIFLKDVDFYKILDSEC